MCSKTLIIWDHAGVCYWMSIWRFNHPNLFLHKPHNTNIRSSLQEGLNWAFRLIFLKNKMHIYISGSVQCVLWGEKSNDRFKCLLHCTCETAKVWLCCCVSCSLALLARLLRPKQCCSHPNTRDQSWDMKLHWLGSVKGFPVICSQIINKNEWFGRAFVCLDKLNACNLG